jgi:hypothetical protein
MDFQQRFLSRYSGMMRLDTIAMILLLFAMGCSEKSRADTQHYIKQLEDDNNISYSKIINTRGAYITPMCYTKMMDLQTKRVSNPCYSCHTKGKVPNYYNDTHLQIAYNFPTEMMQNPYSNLFKDRSKQMTSMSEQAILRYVRRSNYLDDKGEIAPALDLPKEWRGYRPDCYFNFDKEGFDLDPQGEYTGWRAFRYYPFLGTFWPTNGSTDDVIIRLDVMFMLDEQKRFNKEVYGLNLSIVESLIKQKKIVLSKAIDEKVYGVDLNGNGIMDEALTISPSIQNYVGLAKQYLEEKKVHLALGLYPENTEFLHSVRYIDWDEKNEQIMLSERMKELRYAKKYTWKRYGEIERAAMSEFLESASLDSSEAQLVLYPGNYEEGLRNEIGWRYQGFIEDKNGRLRPQTHEETISCMGCHSHLGATIDSTFAFGRKLEGLHKEQQDYGWGHWGQNGLSGLNEPQVEYQNYGKAYEYSFYLHNNHSGNEYRSNNEVQKKFFDLNGSIKPKMIHALHDDITLLLFPSKARAVALNKAYKAIVEEQSYIYGKEAVIKPMENVFKKVKEGQLTGVKDPIVGP